MIYNKARTGHTLDYNESINYIILLEHLHYGCNFRINELVLHYATGRMVEMVQKAKTGNKSDIKNNHFGTMDY